MTSKGEQTEQAPEPKAAKQAKESDAERSAREQSERISQGLPPNEAPSD